MCLHNWNPFWLIWHARKWLHESGLDTNVTTWLIIFESGKNTCTYPEWTCTSPEHFLRCWDNAFALLYCVLPWMVHVQQLCLAASMLALLQIIRLVWFYMACSRESRGSNGQIWCHSSVAHSIGSVDRHSRRSEEVQGSSVAGCRTGLIGIWMMRNVWDESIEDVASGSSSGSYVVHCCQWRS